MKNRLAYSVFAITLMLMGIAVLPASAAFVPVTNETTEQSFLTDENGHTYLYDSNDISYSSQDYLVHDEDVDATKYDYDSNSWSTSTSAFDGSATRDYSFDSWEYVSRGWLDNGTALARFFDFANTTSDPLTVRVESERYVFPLDVGETNSIVIEQMIPHFGTFNLTTEEFVHVTVASMQDDTELDFAVVSPTGVTLGYMSIANGDIQVMPFRPMGEGMYTFYILLASETNSLCTVDVTIEAITPIDFPVDTIVEGVLSGSEYAAENENGDLVHTESAPSAFTYKFYSNSTYPERIRYAMNLPDLETDVYELYEPWIHITSDIYTVTACNTFSYDVSLDAASDPFYFQSFQNESYYLTILGMENVEYVLQHDKPVANSLPINQEFYIENKQSERRAEIFTLKLSEDSVFRVNTTAANDYSWTVFSVFDDLVYRSTSITTNSNFKDASIYYLPAGNYIVKAQATSSSAFGHFEFNFGPVVDGTGPVSVDNGGLIGVRFDTNALDWYNVSYALNTHSNITVETDIQLLNTFGGNVFGTNLQYGNRQSGLGWIEYPSNYTSYILGTFADGFGIAVVSPYYVQNNTAGLVGDEYGLYTLDYTIGVEDGIPWYFNDTASIAMDDAWYNFTLGEPGDSWEYYLVSLDCDIGTWMNVSVYVEDVTDWECRIYQKVGPNYQWLLWSNLDHTFSGSYTSDGAFQFGSISDTVNLMFTVERTLSGEGRLDIAIDPFVTNMLEPMQPVLFMSTGPIVPPGPDMGLVAAGIGITVVAIVVVIVIIWKFKPELLGRFKK
ncbi:MAG: hypothetical protein ACTSUB_06830 [Candidatus Thorarchaeota archaeon]